MPVYIAQSLFLCINQHELHKIIYLQQLKDNRRMKKTLLYFILFVFIYSCHSGNHFPSVSTYAGSGAMGFADGKAMEANFANPTGVAVDNEGNVYVADSHNNLIRKVTPDGIVSTFAGSGRVNAADGRGTEASFSYPYGLATDEKGNLFVADTHHNLIRKISPDGVVTTVAGNKPDNKEMEKDSSLRFDNPVSVAVDKDENIFVVDCYNDKIKKITPRGIITTFAGSGMPGHSDGIGTKASFYLPGGVTVDSSGNVFVADTYNNMIRKITPDGVVTTLAGQNTRGFVDEKGSSAAFSHPQGIAIDKNGNLFVADVYNNRIRKITPNGNVTTIAGSGARGYKNGRNTIATFNGPYGIAVSRDGSIYVADFQNNKVRKITF